MGGKKKVYEMIKKIGVEQKEKRGVNDICMKKHAILVVLFS